ncbi:hypothetical protein JJQ72_15200 [Paenibacillus sp. F411]|uniref:Uncharacterized protein n=1 Tax=Paenibacillus algicola TaxID=2565926 RepID=A0A4P8XGR1_9BACL|nr:MULTISPECIES: DUF2309 domain-containing protein [Paenibacillus]MBO2945322.1 hypothetical protein [Paenibacillus sp. F411]QCT01323.1 hypothetical protein E6C60_0600 [Paenibacillus algicola]
MEQSLNKQELEQFIASRTGAAVGDIRLVLKHEEAYLQKAHQGAKGEVDIDSDDLVDYVLEQRDVSLSELVVEQILDSEMDYLVSKGLAGYLD